MDKEAAKLAVRDVLEEMAAFLSQASPPDLSEADTRAYFVEPVIRALGWTGIGVVQREYYVRSSREFIDYVMSVSGTKVLAIETKRIRVQLSERDAAQLVQYCSVEGVEWAVLTNGRHWQAFNIYLRPDIQAKRLFELDLLDLRDDHAYPAIFERLWLLSRDNVPSAIRSWLDNQRLNAALLNILGDPTSRTIRTASDEVKSSGVNVRPRDIAKWFTDRLCLDKKESKNARDIPGDPKIEAPGDIGSDSASIAVDADHTVSASTGGEPSVIAGNTAKTKRYYGVRLIDLIRSNVLRPGMAVVLVARGQDIATGEINPDGEIVYQGRRYSTPSHPDFARLQGRQASNGWASWYAVLPEGRRSFLELRERYFQMHERE